MADWLILVIETGTAPDDPIDLLGGTPRGRLYTTAILTYRAALDFFPRTYYLDNDQVV